LGVEITRSGRKASLQAGEERMHQLLPAGKNDSVSLMSEELMRGGPHRVYLRAIDRVRELM
jgi:hypothetical protein